MGQDGEFLDLIVERFEFDAGIHPDKATALDEAALQADTLLSNDIWGGLEMDIGTGWSGSTRYPSPPIHKDGNVIWKPKRFILPQDYEQGIRWMPFDGMQQFDVQIEARQILTGYHAIIKLVAYVWDDIKRGDGRLGCLLDLVDRTKYANHCKAKVAETTRVRVAMNSNKKEDINGAHLNGDSSLGFFVSGFDFPQHEPGYRGSTQVTFTSIDIKKRHEDCMYRDR